MYHKVKEQPYMTKNEAAECYPDMYTLMQRDNRDMYDPAGTVLYIGDDFDELFSLMINSNIPLGLVIEGLNHQHSLGGIVIGE
jgi:hypothetical protein